MPSSPTPLLNIEQQAAGENLNVWGQPHLNDALARLTEAIAGATTVSSYPITLSSTNYVVNQARNMILLCTGAGGVITIPAQSKLYIVRNTSSGNVTLTTGSGTTAVVSSGDILPVICDGVNCLTSKRQDFQNSIVRNLANGVNAQDAVNKQQLDATLAAAQAYTDATAFASASLPGQAGQAGKFLTTDGTATSWTNVFPAGTLDYMLFSNGGTSVSWGSPSQIRAKLSLAGAALLNVGTAAGTVAAGDDSRIVNAAQLSGAVYTGAIQAPAITSPAFSGSFSGPVTGNASSATRWTTPRDLSLTGDATATLPAIDGQASVSAAITLANTGVSAGTYGNFTVDAKGRVTAASVAPYIRAAGLFTGTTGAALGTPVNITCVRNAIGLYTLTFGSPLPNANYILSVFCEKTSGAPFFQAFVASRSTSSIIINTVLLSGGVVTSDDPDRFGVSVIL